MGGQITTPPPHKDVPVLVPAACACYLHGTDSAGTTKLRTLQEEAILDYVVGTKPSVSVLRRQTRREISEGESHMTQQREAKPQSPALDGAGGPRAEGSAQLPWTSHHGPADAVVLIL